MVSILAVAETFVILSGGIDLSVGSIVAFSSAFMGELVVHHHLNPILGLGVALLLGIFAGFVHGMIITKARVPPFIVTLGAMQVWRGIALQFTNGSNIYELPDVLTWVGQGSVGPIPASILLAVLVYFVAWIVLTRTKLGLHIYAVGGNEQASRLSGINIDRTKIIIYTISGFLCGVAAILISGRMGATSGNTATGYELDAIAAVVIGGTSLFGGEGVVWGSLIGALMMQVIRNGLNLLSVPAYYQMVVIGLVIIVAVAVDCIRRRKK
jgi:ribose transport system permease protein